MIKNTDFQTGRVLKNRIEQHVPVTEMLIYGSRARGDATTDSDLDVLVVIDDKDATSKEIIYDAAWETGLQRKVVISAIIVTTNEITQTALRSSPLIQSVRRDGIAV